MGWILTLLAGFGDYVSGLMFWDDHGAGASDHDRSGGKHGREG